MLAHGDDQQSVAVASISSDSPSLKATRWDQCRQGKAADLYQTW
jgi:hypothetical protein